MRPRHGRVDGEVHVGSLGAPSSIAWAGRSLPRAFGASATHFAPMDEVSTDVVRLRPHRTAWARGLAVVLAVAALAGACGDDGASAGADDDQPTGATAPDRSAEPAGTDPEAVRPYLETLLGTYDRVVNEIVTDPEVARDETHPLIEQYLGLYEPGSEFAQQLVGFWVERADQGLVTQPFSDEYPITVSALDGDVESVSDDEVSFPYCVAQRLLVLGPDGAVQQRVALRNQRGDGVAVRVDGHWRLRELSVRSDTGRCESEEP
jgi:hypothetical protein